MARLRLRLLGGFAASGEGKEFDHFPTNKARALLAYLAVEPAVAHRRAQLAALLWPEHDEGAALANLRKTLFHLRQTFDDVLPGFFEQALDADRAGVSLRAGAADVDVGDFLARLSATARHEHVALERCPECLNRLAEAADLYRGDLLAGLALSDARPFEEWLTVWQERLHRQALDALHILTVAREAQGEYDAAIDYAARQLALEPWRESAHRRLMSLYAATGRQELALRQYEKCRLVLAEELGVLPSAETEQLLSEIKADRSAFAVGRVDVAHQPAQLHGFPARATTFIGRQAELEAVLDRLLDPRVGLLTLTGYGGSGKTTLAVAAANRVMGGSHPFAGGAWFVPLAGIGESGLLAAAIGAQLGLAFSPKRSPDDDVIAFLSGRPALLVLDNYEHLLPETALVERILRETPVTKLLVTSRAPLNLRAEWRQPVSGLPVPGEDDAPERVAGYEAVRLLETIGSQSDPGFRVGAGNAPALARIARRLDGMPLALEIAGNWLAAYPPEALADQIDASLTFLVAGWRDMPERHRSLEIVFAHSWELLAPRAQQALARATCFQGRFSPAAALAVAGATPGDLNALADHALLRRQPGGRFGLHPVLREFAAGHLADRDVLYRDHAGWYLRRVTELAPVFASREAATAVARVEDEIDDIRQAWRWAALQADVERLAEGLDGLAAFYQFRGLYAEGRDAFASAAAAVEQASHDPLAYRLRLAEAACRLKLGDLEEAIHLAARVQESGNAETLTASLLLLAQLHELRANYDAAISYLEVALARLESTGEVADLALALGQQGWLYRQRNVYERAIPAYERALALNRRLGNELGAAENHAGLGLIYKDTGQFEAAVENLTAARAIAQSLNHRENIARFTQNLGLVYWQMDRLDEALSCYLEALEIAEAIQHRRGMAMCLGTIGVLHRRRYDYPAALAHYERALALFEQLGDQANTAVQLGNIGNVYMDTGKFADALDYMGRALVIDRELGVIEGVSRHLGNIGDTLKDQERFAEALVCFEEGIPALRRTGARYYLCWQLVSCAETLLALGRASEARTLADEGARMAADVGRRQYHFQGRLLAARLATLPHGSGETLALLSGLAGEFGLPEERAELAFWRWQLLGDRDARLDAIALFRPLLAQTGVFRYRQRLDRLGAGADGI